MQTTLYDISSPLIFFCNHKSFFFCKHMDWKLHTIFYPLFVHHALVLAASLPLQHREVVPREKQSLQEVQSVLLGELCAVLSDTMPSPSISYLGLRGVSFTGCGKQSSVCFYLSIFQFGHGFVGCIVGRTAGAGGTVC